MHRATKLLSVAAASAAVFFALPANAAVVLCSSGPGIDLTVDQCVAGDPPSGNDKIDSVEAAIAAATGINVNLTLYGKSDDNASLFSFPPDNDPDNAKTTDWSVLDGTLINYITVKAANNFKVYQLPGAGASSGVGLSTLGILNKGGEQPTISHISFWTAPSSAVPEPGTWGMMLLGFGALGFTLRRRRGKEQTGLRIAF